MDAQTVRSVMTKAPVCCKAGTPVRVVARLMVSNDCGAIPVVDDDQRPIGVITDRDIACRAVAAGGAGTRDMSLPAGDVFAEARQRECLAGRSADELFAAQIMSHPCVTISQEASIDQCCDLMGRHQLRRAVVVDPYGRCIGIVAQADLATTLDDEAIARLVRAVTASPTPAPTVETPFAAFF